MKSTDNKKIATYLRIVNTSITEDQNTDAQNVFFFLKETGWVCCLR